MDRKEEIRRRKARIEKARLREDEMVPVDAFEVGIPAREIDEIDRLRDRGRVRGRMM